MLGKAAGAAAAAAAASAAVRPVAAQHVRSMAIAAQAVRMHAHGKVERVLQKESVDVNDQVTGSQVLLKMLAAPVAPLDISEVEGWAAGAPLPAVGGNQGLAEVAAVGKDVAGLAVGDWVVPCAPKLGTWTTLTTAPASAVTRVEKFALKDADGATDVAVEQLAASIGPGLAAQRLLADFVALEAGDVVVLNGAGSALGQALLQLAAAKGLVTIAIERDHPEWADTVAYWGNLNPANIAASEPFTQTPDFAKVLSDVPAPKLGIDAEGGRAGLVVAQTLAPGGTLVSVGNASGHPLPLTADVLLNKGVSVTGFSLSKWLAGADKAAVDGAIADLVGKTAQGKLVTRLAWEPFADFDLALARAQEPTGLPIVVVMDPSPAALK